MKTLEIDEVTIERFWHSSFRIFSSLNIYIDPYALPEKVQKADLLLITHEHFDHLDLGTIQNILKSETKVIAPQDCLNKIKPQNFEEIKPGKKSKFGEVKVSAINAYNVNKFRSPGDPFHPKDKNWVGFVLEISGKKIYHAGDTDVIPEMKKLKNIDVALLPIGGVYTMDEKEAAEAVGIIKPSIVVPMHYNTFENIRKNPKEFAELIKVSDVEILE